MPKSRPIGTTAPRGSLASAAPRLQVPCPAAKRLIFISDASKAQSRLDKNLLILSLSELCNQIVTDFNPDAVVFSLFGQRDDASTIVARLGEIGFRGKCIVLAPPLPQLESIRAELMSISPALTLELIVREPT